ncbi:MAG: class I mannose-6-phosphate isomerase, partial [Chloroflexi bacterium]|nr:class I mannose-6-phosphate isomerase [Chloroflexota bacterium]
MSANIISPRLVSRVWGGERLAALGPAGAATPPIGEAWFGEIGSQNQPLVKLLDVADRLSIQVHPTNALAAELHGAGSIGKREAWVILDAAPGAHLLLGRDPAVSADQLQHALESGGDVAPLLAKILVSAGDVLDVPPGTLHALMPGLLVWEVQQPSDRTYRVSDWGRSSSERPLHQAEALRAVNVAATAQRVARLDWEIPGTRTIITNDAFAVTVAVGPWSEPMQLPHGAIVTLISKATVSGATGRVAGLALQPLQSAHVAEGSAA